MRKAGAPESRPAAGEAPRIFEPDYYLRLCEIEEHGWSAGMRDAMWALLGRRIEPGRGLRMLDAGCGTGSLLAAMQQAGIGSEPAGIDLAWQALSLCRQRGARRLAQASAVELPFRSRSFDLVLCIDTLQHLSPAGADGRALQELARVLRPGGRLYLRTNSALGHRSTPGTDPDLYRRYTLRQVGAMLAAAGLEVERGTYLNAIPGLWAAIREYTQPPVAHPPSGPALSIRPPSPGRGWRHKALRVVFKLEAFAVRLGIDLPFGHSTAFVARKPFTRKI